MVVQPLPQRTINLLKSTQVITTPASIVKELVENALDAGATAITIKMEKYGFTHLEVRDNGCGIKEEDVEFIAQPHYTSKISAFSDLACLTSYGFRGEALASLCAVSDVNVTTKTNSDAMAHTYTFNHQGHIATVKPAAGTTGTTVISNNLFKNIPVRRQFYNNLKRRREEMKKVEDLVLAFSLAAPNVHFTLSHEKMCIMQKSPAQDLRGAIITTFPSLFKDLVKREEYIEDLSVRIEAYLPNPESSNHANLTRCIADRLFILVNRRPITHKHIEKLVKGLYTSGEDGSHSRYPVGVLSFTLPTESLDVNLEPNKTRILFKDEDQILASLKKIMVALYQPANTASMNSEAGDVDTDITCTFAAVTQPNKRHQQNPDACKTLGLNSDSDSHNIQEEESTFVEDVPPKRRRETPVLTHTENDNKKNNNSNNNDNNRENIPERTDCSNNSQCSKSTPQQRTSIILPAALKDIARTKHDKCDNSNLKDHVINLENKAPVYTSTQDSKTDGIFPSIPDSCVTPIERRQRFMEVTDDDDSLFNSKDNPQDQDLSGITPLMQDLQAVDDKPKHIRESVQDRPCMKEEDVVTSDHYAQETHKLHESIIGSDGVPVFLIPPLQLNENSDHNITSAQNTALQSPTRAHNATLQNPTSAHNTLQNHPSPERVEENSDPNQNNQQKKPYTFKKICPGQSSDNCEKPGSESSKPCESSETHSTDKKPVEGGNEGGSWSRGGAINGKDIQTVQLLTPTVGGKSKEGQLEGTFGKRERPEGNGDQEGPCAPPKKPKNSSLGPTRFEYICGKPIKKPSSPFIIFSREIRSQVLSENPGADFAFIAQEMAARWKALPQDQKLHYNDQAKAESERYQEQVRKVQENRGLNTSIKAFMSKRHITKGSLDKYVAPLTPNMVKNVRKDKQIQLKESQRPWQNRSRQVTFSAHALKKKLNKRQDRSAPSSSFNLIGCVGSSGGGGGWICEQKGTITALNIYRLYEKTLHHTLLSTFKLPVKALDDSLPFNASYLGHDNWNTLLQLPRDLCAERNLYTITDQRLTHSGFLVKLFPNTSGVVTHGEVSHMTPVVAFIGIIDLKEILATITTYPSASLLQSRPLKIQNWIKGETVRMIRAGPNILQQDDIKDKLARWVSLGLGRGDDADDGPVGHRDTCIHNKPILSRLFCINDLSMSQSQLSL